MTLYGVVLDSGCIVREFMRRDDAHDFADRINVVGAEQRARGDLVSIRRAVGIVSIKRKPFTPCQPGGSRGGRRGKRAPATSSKGR